MAIFLPLKIDERTNKFHLVISKEVFDCLQFMFFVYPDTMVKRNTKNLRINHLLDYEDELIFSLKELSVFCEDIAKWRYTMDVWQGSWSNPFDYDLDLELLSSLENDINAIKAIISPSLIGETSFYSE